MTRFLLLLAVVLLGSVQVWATDNNRESTTTTISFEDFVQKYGKVYESEEERKMRQEIYHANVLMIRGHNLGKAPGHGHVLTVNEWADRRIPEELPLGLYRKGVIASEEEEDPLNLMFVSRPTKTQSTDKAEAYYQDWLQNQMVPVSDLPKEVDWRTHNPKIITGVKNQGFCGSCWAVASTAVLESHIALKTGQLYTLSPQELVSCVENKQHCGGGGGCQGATYELAFEYVMEHGMVTNKEFPYSSGKGRSPQCTLVNQTTTTTTTPDASTVLLRGGSSGTNDDNNHKEKDNYIHDAVATIDGYINFPTNNYTVLMNAVATIGPIGVTVAASSWSFYGGGVFESDHTSSSATTVNHAVVLEGYGVDQESQEPFWLVRNSWGTMWGEHGYIRLKRVDPSTLPDFDKDDCGTDKHPADGAACTKDKDGNPITPKPVKVCGTSAILFDTFVPVGGHLINNNNNNNNNQYATEAI